MKRPIAGTATCQRLTRSTQAETTSPDPIPTSSAKAPRLWTGRSSNRQILRSTGSMASANKKPLTGQPCLMPWESKCPISTCTPRYEISIQTLALRHSTDLTKNSGAPTARKTANAAA
eukprot:142489-Pyramimonas_sp.AAC.1